MSGVKDVSSERHQGGSTQWSSPRHATLSDMSASILCLGFTTSSSLSSSSSISSSPPSSSVCEKILGCVGAAFGFAFDLAVAVAVRGLSI
ncbi:hypothetical protein KCU93_g495, partial [Aureobasidium melanogenum]